MSVFLDLINTLRPRGATRLRDAYRQVFHGPYGEMVLQDLAEVCQVTDMLDDLSPEEIVARQKVYRHMCNMMRMPDETIDGLTRQAYEREGKDYYGDE